MQRQERTWYNIVVVRRLFAFALLVALALPLAGSIAVVFECEETCTEEDAGSTCPPDCTVCTTCAHASKALVEEQPVTSPHSPPHPLALPVTVLALASYSAEILHVPLAA